MNTEHLSDEQLGIGRYRCTPAERARLEALAARYAAALALEFELPPDAFPKDGPFFPPRSKFVHEAPSPSPNLPPQHTPPHL